MKAKFTRGMLYIVAIVFVVVSLAACGPAQIEHTKQFTARDTVYVIPLEGKTKEEQRKFQSIEFLELNRIGVKRITIPTRKKDTGRMPWDYEWIETDAVIVVDRSPVTREWTARADTGSSKEDKAVWVQSLDNILFGVGVTMTTSVQEKDCSKFLYFNAGRTLAEITDSNIRGHITSLLSSKFGTLPHGNAQQMMEQPITKDGKPVELPKTCLTERSRVAKEVFDEAKKYWLDNYGITIDNFGLAEGFTYRDPKIQASINANFAAGMKIQEERNNNEAQAAINQREIDKAEAAKNSAKKFAEAAEARTKQVQLDIQRMEAEARLNMSTRWDGKLPLNIMPQDSKIIADFVGRSGK